MASKPSSGDIVELPSIDSEIKALDASVIRDPLAVTEDLAKLILDQSIEIGIVPAMRENRVSVGAFFGMLNRRADLMNAYLSAQQIAAEIKVSRIAEIAEFEPSIDRAKLKIDAYKWTASKLMFRKYGDKSIVENVSIDIRGSIADAIARSEGKTLEIKPPVTEPSAIETSASYAVAETQPNRRPDFAVAEFEEGDITPIEVARPSFEAQDYGEVPYPLPPKPGEAGDGLKSWTASLLKTLPVEGLPEKLSPNDPAWLDLKD